MLTTPSEEISAAATVIQLEPFLNATLMAAVQEGAGKPLPVMLLQLLLSGTCARYIQHASLTRVDCCTCSGSVG
jgi:hypothetical protein